MSYPILGCSRLGMSIRRWGSHAWALPSWDGPRMDIVSQVSKDTCHGGPIGLAILGWSQDGHSIPRDGAGGGGYQQIPGILYHPGIIPGWQGPCMGPPWQSLLIPGILRDHTRMAWPMGPPPPPPPPPPIKYRMDT